MKMDLILMSLVCGHLLGDFLLQNDWLAEKKRESLAWLVLHVGVVGLVTWILLGSVASWWIGAFLFLVHFLIDLVKKLLSGLNPKTSISPVAGKPKENKHEKRKHSRRLWWFIGDQGVHLLSILSLWVLVLRLNQGVTLQNYWFDLWRESYVEFLIIVCGVTLSVWGAAALLKHQMAYYSIGLEARVGEGIPRGGARIGILERMLVFAFVLAGKPEAVGFLVAAKSVFRIGDLKDGTDKGHAEYIMIGSLSSFTYALLVAFGTRWLLANYCM